MSDPIDDEERSELSAEVQRLRARLAREQGYVEGAEASHRRAEAENDELRAEVARLRIVARLATDAGDDARAAAREAPARTEAEPSDCMSCDAKGRVCDGGDHCDNCGARMDGDIAATADVCHDCWRSAKARTEAVVRTYHGMWPPGVAARTEAERAVLDAMGLVPESVLRDHLTGDIYGSPEMVDLCRAELARRGLKP